LLRILEEKLKLNELAREWEFWSRRIAEAARELLGPCEVYVFGSAVKGLSTGASDVDILIISDQLPKKCRDRGNLKANMEERAGLPLYHPFEIHLVTSREVEENPIYRHAISEGLKLYAKQT